MPAKFVKLPTYPWQKERYWKEPKISIAYRLGQALHPFLRYQSDCAHTIWNGKVDQNEFDYLVGHRVDNEVIFPGAAYVDMALSLGTTMLGDNKPALNFVRFHKALNLSEPAVLQASIDRTGQFSIFSRDQNEVSDWCLRASGAIEEAVPTITDSLSIDMIKDRLINIVPKHDLYKEFTLMGLDYCGPFQAIEMLYVGVSESLAQIKNFTTPDARLSVPPSLA